MRRQFIGIHFVANTKPNINISERPEPHWLAIMPLPVPNDVDVRLDLGDFFYSQVILVIGWAFNKMILRKEITKSYNAIDYNKFSDITDETNVQ